MAEEGWLLLGKLKRAVKKIKFLLSFNMMKRLKLLSLIGASSSKRRLTSFKDERPGLMACVDDPDLQDTSTEKYSSSNGHRLQRTTSYPSSSEDDDVDKRADAFIANFYKQLRYDRQISLELRYYRGNSFDSSDSP